MSKSKKAIAVIPARGGSKRIPRKNVKPLRGKTLIARSVAVALNSECFDRVIVSTDDNEIAIEASRAGAEVPFMRPSELSTDSADSLSVLLHAIKFVEQSLSDENYSLVALLQPTSPFLKVEQLIAGIDRFYENDFISLSSMVKVDKPIEWMFQLEQKTEAASPVFPDLFFKSSKDLPVRYIENGAFYLVDRNHLINNESLYDISRHGSFIMDSISSLDIDNPDDWEYAEYLANKLKL